MRLCNKLKEGQPDRKAFESFAPEIALYNLNILRRISWSGAIGGALLVLCCLPPLRLLTMPKSYLALTAVFLALAVMTHTLLRSKTQLVLPAYYIFSVLLLCVSIAMGTFWGRDGNAVTFVMLVVVLQLLVIDKPMRMNLIFGLLCVAFCIVDCHAKNGILLRLDISNCVVFFLLSLVLSRQSIDAKLSDIVIKHELKLQRDLDALTKLSNRGAFERQVQQYLMVSDKNAVMIIMDLDNFKSVNDLMGHEYGDLVLRRVGEYLQTAFRQGDFVSRLGGDEFVAFLPAVGEPEVIIKKVSALLSRISGLEQELKLSCPIGASAGISRFPADGNSFDELYRLADEALYRAKAAGKGCVEIYKAE